MGVSGATGSSDEVARVRGADWSVVFLTAVSVLGIVVMNQIFDLKDREIYRYYFASIDSCRAVACLFISDDVRSPVFLSLLIAAQRLGLSVDMAFSLISSASLLMFFAGIRAMSGSSAPMRLLLISICLGTWLYLIQVKLFLAVALYIFSRMRSGNIQRVGLAVAAVLTHETVIVLMVLDFAWNARSFRINFRVLLLLSLAAFVLVLSLGDAANVVLSGLERLRRYQEFSSRGEVPELSRFGMQAVLLLLFGMIGLLRVERGRVGGWGALQVREKIWMFLPWAFAMIFARNAVIATRIAELVLLHCLIAGPVGRHWLSSVRIAVFLFAVVFGALTLVRDVVFA